MGGGCSRFTGSHASSAQSIGKDVMRIMALIGPPPGGPETKSVYVRSLNQRGRRSRPGWRSRPLGVRWNEDLRRRRLVGHRPVRVQGVVEAPPALHDDPGFGERVDDLTIEQFIAEPGVKGPMKPLFHGLPGSSQTESSARRSPSLISTLSIIGRAANDNFVGTD